MLENKMNHVNILGGFGWQINYSFEQFKVNQTTIFSKDGDCVA
jgi:hypothetical protein